MGKANAGAHCYIRGCNNRRSKDLVQGVTRRYFRLPAVKRMQGRGGLTAALARERRRLWEEIVNKDLTKINPDNVTVCSDHFISGYRAELFDRNNPDWLPNIRLEDDLKRIRMEEEKLKQKQDEEARLEEAIQKKKEEKARAIQKKKEEKAKRAAKRKRLWEANKCVFDDDDEEQNEPEKKKERSMKVSQVEESGVFPVTLVQSFPQTLVKIENAESGHSLDLIPPVSPAQQCTESTEPVPLKMEVEDSDLSEQGESASNQDILFQIQIKEEPKAPTETFGYTNSAILDSVTYVKSEHCENVEMEKNELPEQEYRVISMEDLLGQIGEESAQKYLNLQLENVEDQEEQDDPLEEQGKELEEENYSDKLQKKKQTSHKKSSIKSQQKKTQQKKSVRRQEDQQTENTNPYKKTYNSFGRLKTKPAESKKLSQSSYQLRGNKHQNEQGLGTLWEATSTTIDIKEGLNNVHHAVNSNHCNEVFKSMYVLQQSGSYCDFYITDGNEELAVHYIVLSAASPLFLNYKHHPSKRKRAENGEKEVYVANFPVFFLRDIIRFIYTGSIYLQEDNVKVFKRIFTEWQIESGIACCNAYLKLLEENGDQSTCGELVIKKPSTDTGNLSAPGIPLDSTAQESDICHDHSYHGPRNHDKGPIKYPTNAFERYISNVLGLEKPIRMKHLTSESKKQQISKVKPRELSVFKKSGQKGQISLLKQQSSLKGEESVVIERNAIEIGDKAQNQIVNPSNNIDGQDLEVAPDTTCWTCCKFFNSISELNEHHMEFHKKKELTTFQDKQTKEKPKKKVTRKPLELKMCQKCHRYVTGAHAESHKSKCTTCFRCEESFKTKRALEKHGVYCRDSYRPKCEICTMSFSEKRELVNHKKILHPTESTEITPSFICHVECCPFSGSTAHSLEQHQTVHVTKKCVCNDCQTILSNEFDLQCHRIKEHAAMLKCYECGDQFSEIKDLQDHQLKNHKGNVPEHLCSICAFGTCRPETLARHSFAKHGIIPDSGPYGHICPYCGKGIWRESAMDEHILRNHEVTEKNYQCDACGKTFHTEKGVKEHKKRFHNPNLQVHKCPDCDYSTNWGKDRLQGHIKRVHKKIRPHACDRCDYRSSVAGNLRNHRLRIHGIEPQVKTNVFESYNPSSTSASFMPSSIREESETVSAVEALEKDTIEPAVKRYKPQNTMKDTDNDEVPHYKDLPEDIDSSTIQYGNIGSLVDIHGLGGKYLEGEITNDSSGAFEGLVTIQGPGGESREVVTLIDTSLIDGELDGYG